MLTPTVMKQLESIFLEANGITDIKLSIAAPELLAACKMACDFLNYGETMHSPKLVYDTLKAAIEKATGK